MTMTENEAKQSFQQILNMSGALTREKLITIQNYLDASDIDFSTTNGSKVFTVMSKFAKGPLNKLLAGVELTEDDQIKIQAAAHAGAEQRLTKHTFYQGRDIAVAELNQTKLENARKESIIAGADLPRGVKAEATRMYTAAQQDPDKIPDFLDFAEQMIDENSPIWDQERIRREDAAAGGFAEIQPQATPETPEKDAFQEHMDGNVADAAPKKPHPIFSNPGKINQPGPLLKKPVSEKQTPLMLVNPINDSKTPEPAVMPPLVKKALAERERQGVLKTNFPLLAEAANEDNVIGKDTKKRLGFFSALVRPARVAVVAAAASLAVSIGVSSFLFGDGQNNDVVDLKANADLTQTTTAAPEYMATAPVFPTAPATLIASTDTAYPLQRASLGGMEILMTLFRDDQTSAKDINLASFATPAYDTLSPVFDEAQQRPFIPAMDGIPTIEANIVTASFEPNLEPLTVEIDQAGVKDTVGLDFSDFDQAGVKDTVGLDFSDFDQAGVKDTVGLDLSGFNPDYVPATVGEVKIASLDSDALMADLKTETPAAETVADPTTEADINMKSASMDNFENGITALFNGNVPDALTSHLNGIGNGLNTVDDAIFAYRALAELPNHAKGGPAHAFAMQNFAMIAEGNFGPVSELARDALQSDEWMAKRYDLQDDKVGTQVAKADGAPLQQARTNG